MKFYKSEKNPKMILYKIWSEKRWLTGCDDVQIWDMVAYPPSTDCAPGEWIRSYLASDINRCWLIDQILQKEREHYN